MQVQLVHGVEAAEEVVVAQDEEQGASLVEETAEAASSSWADLVNHSPPKGWPVAAVEPEVEPSYQTLCLDPWCRLVEGCATAHFWICGPSVSLFDFWT